MTIHINLKHDTYIEIRINYVELNAGGMSGIVIKLVQILGMKIPKIKTYSFAFFHTLQFSRSVISAW